MNSSLKLSLLLCVLCVSVATHASAARTIDAAQAVRAIVGEAASQGERGMLAVAGAIRNRGHLEGVYGLNNPQAEKASPSIIARAQLAWAISATNDITGGATHWENVRAFGPPKWARHMTITTRIGAHTFFKPKTRQN